MEHYSWNWLQVALIFHIHDDPEYGTSMGLLACRRDSLATPVASGVDHRLYQCAVEKGRITVIHETC
jgi:hypothetical protein